MKRAWGGGGFREAVAAEDNINKGHPPFWTLSSRDKMMVKKLSRPPPLKGRARSIWHGHPTVEHHCCGNIGALVHGDVHGNVAWEYKMPSTPA